MRTHKIVSRVHKWVGLLIGIQFLCWTMGGVVMTWIPIETVRGEHNIAEQPPLLVEALKLEALLTKIGNPQVVSLTAKAVGGIPAVVVQDADGVRGIYALETAEKLTPVNEEMVLAIARADFKGQAGAVSAKLLSGDAPNDYRGPLPVWRVDMADEEGSVLYVSPDQARVVARRTDVWRFYDFFWMLHIMDYDTRDNFNNPLVMVAGATGMLFVLSGIGLLFFRFRRRDFGMKPKLRRKAA
jgi:uncharacterized iron-regulated membrane protein